ncbi:Uncharacterised protein family (UPF0104) [Legionella lansingensis]|uniref:Transmembrane protein n=2 Tax=Legionella lansingensis TaxID=45067 RepID=A0A0W0VYS0_9GAMM|nr:hypothetical protein Llan_0174 [Legionella lansingensis]SNV51428.1 Uncharacterised protein family (UPF0104) [Legionella lansingensis]
MYSFEQVRWHDFINCIKHIEIKWVLLMAAALAISMFLRSIRWQIITRLPWSEVGRVWEASCIGYLGTAIYPAKAGDVLKIVRLQKLTGISSGEAVVSTVVDRILDGLALCVLLCILLLAWGKQLLIGSGIWWIAIGFILAFLIVAFYCLNGHRLERFFLWLAEKNVLGRGLNQIYQQSMRGMNLLRSPQLIFPCLLLQTLITLFDVMACWFLFHAFGWKEMSLLPALVMLVYLAAAFSLPSTPGYIGVYQVASIFALSLFGIGESEAVAYGTIFQTVAFILFVGVGLKAQFWKAERALHLD